MADALVALPDDVEWALAFARRSERERLEAPFRLDARLGAIVRGAREPLLAQMKLAWWRDRLRDGGGDAPELRRLRMLGLDGEPLVPIVDAWEVLLGARPLPEAAMLEFARGRSVPFGSNAVGEGWALADLALRWGETAARAPAEQRLATIPRALPRPLRVLARLTRAELAAGGGPRSRRALLRAVLG